MPNPACSSWMQVQSLRFHATFSRAPNLPPFSGSRLVPGTLCNEAAVDLARVVVCLLGLGQFAVAHARRFLGPALVHGVQAPLRAGTRSANWLTSDHRENRVGMGRRQHSRGDPTAFLHW